MRQAVTLTRPDGSTFLLFGAGAQHNAGGDESLAAGSAADLPPVVVISPAMGMPAAYYAPFLEALAEVQVHGYAYEQRGHEVDGQPAGWRRNFGYAELVDDLEQVIGQLRGDHPGSPVFVIGHSLGGQVAVSGIGQRPGLFDGLILIASSTPYWRVWSPKVLAAALLFPALAAVLGYFPGHRLKFAGREARTMITQWGRLARTGRLPYGEAGLGEVDVPLLAISIDGDWLAVPAGVDALCEKLPAASVERRHVEEAGIDHFKWARRPESVMGHLSAWLSALPARR